MTDAFTDSAAQPPMQTRSERNFDHLNPSFAADHAARADDPPGLRKLEDGLIRGWAVTLSEHLENTGPSHWRQQHVADRAHYADERATRAERQVLTDAEDAFARLNPDFGVLPDAHHAGQHAFAQQREAALALAPGPPWPPWTKPTPTANNGRPRSPPGQGLRPGRDAATGGAKPARTGRSPRRPSGAPS